MIELIASLGYIVVISDYPGFGASVSIPHPYLVKEPTVMSLIDNLRAVKELAGSELPGINLIMNIIFSDIPRGVGDTRSS